ncbi:hypothetical protein NQ315_007354 [Exocentrus adspersus]|uniref:Cytochrome P450 n=1 Tax=Exocentrus adspersus TaxID=1586481 RepID=A0AAV8VH47_9CUCU|nr:hypothetical protein NQ315_007354 [Exocentrus adspersus]
MAFYTGSFLFDLLAVATALLAVTYAYFKWKYQYWKWRNVPYIEPTIPFGNIGNPFRTPLGEEMARVYKMAKARGWKYCGLYSMLKPVLLVVDLDLVKHILTKDFQHFTDRNVYTNEKSDPLSSHLFALGGNRWRNLRAKLSPTFTSGRIKSMFQTLVDCGLILEKYIEKNISPEEPVDIKNILACFSTDVIGSCAFGIDCNSFENPNSAFRVYSQRLFTVTKLKALKGLLLQSFGGLGRALGIKSVPTDIADFFTKVVSDTVTYREKNNVLRKDFLQLLIDLRRDDKDEQHTGHDVERDGKSLSMDEIVAQSFVFFLAGFETSSTSTTFALFELATHQDIQDRLRTEILDTLKKHDNKITYDSLSEMKYLDQVVNETMRLRTVAQLLQRMCTKDYKVPGEDLIIEKGTTVFISVMGAQKDEEYWENPQEFNPDRFNEKNKNNVVQYASMPFGEGPRACIGERFGLMQVKVGLTCLLRKFKVTLDEKTQLPLKISAGALVPTAKTMIASSSILLDVLGVVTAIVAVGYALVYWRYSYWKKKGAPCFEPTFPFGNLPNPYFSSNPVSFGDGIMQLYRKAKSKGYRHLGMYFMLRPSYMVIDLELVKHIMTKDFQHFVDRGMYYNEKDDPLSAHLFAVGGKKWRSLRTKLTPTFTSGKMRAMFQTLVDCGLVLENYVEEYTKTKESIDIKNVLGTETYCFRSEVVSDSSLFLGCFSTDIIGSCAFGLECNSFKDPDSAFRQYGNKIFQPTASKLWAFIRMMLLQNYTLAKALKLRLVSKEVNDFFTKVVKDTIDYREKNKYVRNDFLQLLINSRDKNEGKSSGVAGNNLLTMNEIMAQSYVFFIAGFETSSTTMTFALFELAIHPQIQDKLREEISTVLKKHQDQITYDSLNDLKYMSQVIDETLRKYAPLSYITRECVEDYKVPGEDVVVEKGTRVVIPVRGIHYDEEYYPDPEKFDPDRFTEENKRNRHQYAHIPFGEGPRICIGQRFGIMQSKVGLTCILRKFRVTLDEEKTPLPLQMNPRAFITTSKGGIWLNLEKL